MIEDVVFAQLMRRLERAFPTVKLTKEVVDLYWDFLNDVNEDALIQAVSFMIATRKDPRFPTVGELRAAVFGSLELKAIEAWGQAKDPKFTRHRMEEEGPENEDDQLVRKVIRTAWGREQHFGRAEVNEAADRRAFIDTYKLVAVRERKAPEQRLLSAKQFFLDIGQKKEE